MFIVSVDAKICVVAVHSYSTHTPSIFVGVRSQWIYRSVSCNIYFFFETKQKVRKQRNTLFPHSLRAKDKHTTSSNLHQLVVYQLSSSVFLSSLEPLSLSPQHVIGMLKKMDFQTSHGSSSTTTIKRQATCWVCVHTGNACHNHFCCC